VWLVATWLPSLTRGKTIKHPRVTAYQHVNNEPATHLHGGRPEAQHILRSDKLGVNDSVGYTALGTLIICNSTQTQLKLTPTEAVARQVLARWTRNHGYSRLRTASYSLEQGATMRARESHDSSPYLQDASLLTNVRN
jgi:hypothetical protein